jgi:hypothetical protein
MKKIAYVFLTVVLAVSLFGCATISPFIGAVFTQVKYPHNHAVVSTDGTIGSKMGKSTAYFILGIAAFGDASVQEAARMGGITEIKTVEHEYMNVLAVVYGQYTTIVTGE